MLLKNICVGVHILVKLPAANLLKMNFFTHIFQGFWLDFKLLFFSRNHFLEGGLTFQWGVFALQLGGASFLNEGVPHMGHRFWWKYCRVYLCNNGNVTENNWVTRAKLGGKIFMSKNTGDVR